jgi:hypothetical protein
VNLGRAAWRSWLLPWLFLGFVLLVKFGTVTPRSLVRHHCLAQGAQAHGLLRDELKVRYPWWPDDRPWEQ